mmetsp:Transcript_12236/g.26043  ORF Transcript_12236/g.26043 Transcript_12236/m.26043 type:complete len:250 (-) Transcript_12236:166-915(-)
MPLWSEDDLSLSKDSVFDWGSLPSGSEDKGKAKDKEPIDVSTLANAEGQRAASGKDKLYRYDPTNMTRITDITDLVDDSSDDNSDDEAVIGKSSSMQISGADEENCRRRKRSSRTKGSDGRMAWCRHAIIFTFCVAAVGGTIGHAVTNNNSQKGASSSQEGGVRGSGGDTNQEQQELLETAERVSTACSENKLNEDLSECQKLCHSMLCCFQGGDYSCEMDKGQKCAVYAGCEALVQGVPLGAVKEEEQ